MTADVDIIVVERPNVLLLPVETVKSERIMTAILTIPGTDFSRLSQGQSVELDLGHEKRVQGKITKLNDSVNSIEVSLKESKQTIRPGRVSVNLVLEDGTISDIPAILRFGRQYYVMLKPKEDDVEKIENIKRLIQVGEQNDVYMEVLSGLNEGDEIVIQDNMEAGSEQFGRRRR